MAYTSLPTTITDIPSPTKAPSSITGIPTTITDIPARHGNVIIFNTLVSSVTVLQSVQSDLGVTLNGSTVSAWADQSGAGKNYTQISAPNQPTYVASGLNGQPTIKFVRATGQNLVSLLNLPAPGTTPTYAFAVARMTAWTSGTRFFAATSSANAMILFQAGVTPQMSQFNTTQVNTVSPTNNSWYLVEVYFSNSTSDFQRWGPSTVTGANAGNSSGTGREIASGAGGGTTYADMEIAALMYTAGLPTNGERTALQNAAVSKYGAINT